MDRICNKINMDCKENRKSLENIGVDGKIYWGGRVSSTVNSDGQR
jgi:hypothetical protein